MPTETAVTRSRIGLDSSFFSPTAHSKASLSAAQAALTAAVRVPPSAWITSQSTFTIISPICFRWTTERSDRPISREISLERPPVYWLRRIRCSDEPGSMLYSAVIQPDPDFCIHLGTELLMEAVASTTVRPISIRTDPGVISVYP